MSSLQERLREAFREAPGKVRKTDLWRAAKVSSGAVTQWFDGSVKSMAWEYAQKIAPVLGVQAQWLYDGSGPMRPVEAKIPDEPVTNAPPLSPSVNSQTDTDPTHSTPAPTITYEVIRSVVAGALQGFGVRFEDLVKDEVAARLGIEAAIGIQAKAPLPASRGDYTVTGAEVIWDETGNTGIAVDGMDEQQAEKETR